VNTKTIFATACLMGLSLAVSANATTISRNYEAPTVQNTTATFSTLGVETFDSRATGHQTFSTDFGSGGVLSATFTNFPVVVANVYGGVGGVGNYAQQFSGDGLAELTLSENGHGVTYLGFWLSALSGGNTVSFYDGANLVQTYDASTVFDGIAPGSLNSYKGNPTAPYLGQNSGEPYAFVNFYANGGTFDRVVFQQTQGGGFELDNVTVGTFTSIGGVPETGTWVMMLFGVAALGGVLRLHSRADRKLRALEATPA
jgi:hypothetical protein